MSVDVERVFSKGRLILSHICNRLSVETTRALMCLGNWSKQGHIPDNVMKAASKLLDVKSTDILVEADEYDDIL